MVICCCMYRKCMVIIKISVHKIIDDAVCFDSTVLNEIESE